MLTWHVEVPETGLSYDVGPIQLEVVLHHSVLSFLTGGDDVSHMPLITLVIKSDDLPERLNRAIEVRLTKEWDLLRHGVGCIQQGRNRVGLLCLEAPVKSLKSEFVSHITCLPELLERYNSVDGSGATVRRCAIINQADPEVEAPEVEAPACMTPLPPQPSPIPTSPIPCDNGITRGLSYPEPLRDWGAPSIVPSSNKIRCAEGSRLKESCPQPPQPQHLGSREDQRSSRKVIAPTALMTGKDITRDLMYLERRYRTAFKQRDGNVTLTPLEKGGQLQAELGYTLELTPTDPCWRQSRGAMVVTLSIQRVSTPHTQQFPELPEPLLSQGSPPLSLFHPTIVDSSPGQQHSPSTTCNELLGSSVSTLADTAALISDQVSTVISDQAVSRIPRRESHLDAPGSGNTNTFLGAGCALNKPITRSNPSLLQTLHPIMVRGGGGLMSKSPTVHTSANADELYSLVLRVESGTMGIPSWLAASLDDELSLSLLHGALPQAAGGSGSDPGSALPCDKIQVGMGSLKRTILDLENYGGEMAARAELEAMQAGERTRLGGRDAGRHHRRESLTEGAVGPPRIPRASGNIGYEEEEDDGFWSVDECSTSEEVLGSDTDDDNFSDDGYGEGSARFTVADEGAKGQMRRPIEKQDDFDFFDLDDGSGEDRRLGKHRNITEGSEDLVAGHIIEEGLEPGPQEYSDELSSGAPKDEAKFHGGADGEKNGEESGTGAWHCVLEGLQLDFVEAAELIRAPFQVACGRCGKSGEMAITSEAVSTPSASSAGGGASRAARGDRTATLAHKPFEALGQCTSCHVPWHALARPKFVHGGSNILCALKLRGCVARDLLPCMMAVQCSSCSGVMTMRGVQVGMPHERSCSSCHHRIAFSFSAVSFIPRTRGPQAVGPQGASVTKSARGCESKGGGRAPVLQVGMPLPSMGTCKHYRHSYRWLRFPCCGARFACDLCHEEATDHAMKWATRMACGFCSLEQPVSNMCVGCGRKLACAASNPLGKATRFWEGGGGCRDTRFMTSKDAHKYRGKAKTKSAKSTRVGPKAWSKELKKDKDREE